MYFLTSSKSSRRSKRRSMRASNRMKKEKFARSVAMIRSMSGYCTFTATTWPSWSRALCTWASDADAIGLEENSAKHRSSGRSSCSSIHGAIMENGRGGTLSCSSDRICTN